MEEATPSVEGQPYLRQSPLWPNPSLSTNIRRDGVVLAPCTRMISIRALFHCYYSYANQPRASSEYMVPHSAFRANTPGRERAAPSGTRLRIKNRSQKVSFFCAARHSIVPAVAWTIERPSGVIAGTALRRQCLPAARLQPTFRERQAPTPASTPRRQDGRRCESGSALQSGHDA